MTCRPTRGPRSATNPGPRPAPRRHRHTAAATTLALLILVAAGCERERRTFRETLPASTADRGVQATTLQAGPPGAVPAYGAYQENRWAVSQGHTLYLQFNCAGCHAPGGGGGMGPPLIDSEWIYGSEPQNIFDTIVEGRPNGMPSYRGRISSSQVWQLVAFVRAMGGLTPRDTWPGRSDAMEEATPRWEAAPPEFTAP